MPEIMTAEEIRAMWRRFFALAPEFHKNQRNVDIVATEAQATVKSRNMPVSEQTLLVAYKRIEDALDKKPKDAQAPIAQAQEPVSAEPSEEYSEATDPNFPQRGPHEPGHIFQGRVNFYRESRLKRIWMEKENERLRNAPHHADTIRRTRGEQTMIEAQKDWYTAKRAAQTFGKKSPN